MSAKSTSLPIRKLSWAEVFLLFKQTVKAFFKEKSFFHGAALSYYTIFALIPIIYLSITAFGYVVGQQNMELIIGDLLRNQVGIEDISGIMDFLKEVDFEKENFALNLIGIISLVVSSTALFASLKMSINEFYNVERVFEQTHKAILADLLSRAISIGMLSFFGLVLIITYFGQIFLVSFGQSIFENIAVFQWFFSTVVQQGVSIAANWIIFASVFKWLNDGKVRWKLAFAGSLLTSVLMYLGHILIKYYLTNFFFAKNGGIAGSLLIILTFVYYSSQIIFFGAKFTAEYGKMVNQPIESR